MDALAYFLIAILTLFTEVSATEISGQNPPAPEVASVATPTPSPSLSPANAPIECFLLALELPLSIHKSILLCTQATTLDPIRCYREIREFITPDQKVNLCQGASSQGPIQCFNESLSLKLSVDQRTKLCNGTQSDTPVQCFRKSLQFLFLLSQDQKVILCASATSDDPVQCFINSSNLGLTADQRVRLCTQLTPSSW